MEKVVHKFEFVARLQIRRERSRPPDPRRRSFLEPPASGANGNYFGFHDLYKKRSKPRQPHTQFFHPQTFFTMITTILLSALMINPTQFNHLQVDTAGLGFAAELEETAKAGPAGVQGQKDPFKGMAGFIIGSDVNPWQVAEVNKERKTAVVVIQEGACAGVYGKVPFELFEQTAGGAYIICSDIAPYQ